MNDIVRSRPLPGRPVPRWYDDAKFGIFIHWTAAAIPAFAPTRHWDLGAEDLDWVAFLRDNPYAEMYQNTMHVPGSPTSRFHAEHYGETTFDDFVEQFRAGLSGWDPEPWAELFQRAGARYVVLVTKHMDGFLLWPTATPNPHKQNWQSERDIVGELAAALRARGMRFGTYYCGGIDWTFGGLPVTSGPEMVAATPQDEAYVRYATAHWHEIIDRYETSLLWNDMGYPRAADTEALIAAYLDRVPDGVVNDRFSPLDPDMQTTKSAFHDFTTLEYRKDYSAAPTDQKWESCRGIGASFGYNRDETEALYANSTQLIHELVDIVARGGNLLLNVGPTAAGEIPWLQAKRLLELGWWMHANGNALYGTRRWDRPAGRTGEGIDVRYTAAEDAVYAIVLGTPMANQIQFDIHLDSGAIATLEGSPLALRWEPAVGGVRVELRERPPEGPALAVKFSPRAAVHS